MRKGFTLLEFLVFCAALLAVSTVLLPRALAPRRDLNEEHAVGYLAMIGAAERAWLAETGDPAPLTRLARVAPARPGGIAAGVPPLLPPDILFDSAGVGHRGGFRFRLGDGEGGRPQGCWAWPNLRGYSGEHSYWADFGAREIRRARARYSWTEEPPLWAPADGDLEDEVLGTF